MAFNSAIHSVKKYRLGTRLKDASGGEWVYGVGVASTVAGDFVVFDKAWQSARLTTSSAGGPIGVAGAALVASTYGWYQVFGVSSAVTNVATASSIGLGLSASSTAGRATSTAAAGKTLFGAVSAENAVSNAGKCFLNYPTFMNQSTL